MRRCRGHVWEDSGREHITAVRRSGCHDVLFEKFLAGTNRN